MGYCYLRVSPLLYALGQHWDHKAAYLSLSISLFIALTPGDNRRSIGTTKTLGRALRRYGTLWPVKIRHFRRQSRMRACRPLENCCRGVVASRRRFVDPVRIVLFQLNESTRYPYVCDRPTSRRGIIRNCFHHAFLPAYLRAFAYRIAFLNLVSGISLIDD